MPSHKLSLVFSLSLFSSDKKFTSVGRIGSLLHVPMTRFSSGNVKLIKKVASRIATASTGSHTLVKLLVYIILIYRSKFEWKPVT